MSGPSKTNRAILLAGAGMLAAMVLLAAGLVYSQFASSTAQAQIEALRRAQVVATQFSWMFQTSAQALQRVEQAVATDSGSAPDGDFTTIKSISKAVSNLPTGFQYSVYDLKGRLIYSSIDKPNSINVSDRGYFARLLAGSELVISPMLTERLTGEQVFIVARRLDNGVAFAGVATIAIPVSTLTDLAAALGVTDGSTISLVANDGMVIARAPPVEPVDISDSPLFKELEHAANGFYSAASPVDGIDRIVGYWQMDDWPVIAVAGVAKKSAFASFRSQIRVGLYFFLPIAVFCIWLAYRVIKLMRIDEERREQLMVANERSNFLLREIHHRVKNNLQTVVSLIRIGNLPAADKSSLMGRIAAMVAVHEEMYASDQLEQVNVADFLSGLVRNIAAGFGTKVELVLDMVPVKLSGERAMQLGLLTNELVSNAFKHAFSGRSSGKLEVRLVDLGAGSLRLCVSDDGPGFNPADTSANVGSRLVEALTEQLGGTLTTATDGRVSTTVDFPGEYPSDPQKTPLPKP